MQKNLNLLFLDIFELHPRIVLNINACFTHSSSNKPPLGTCILPGYSSIKGHWNQEPQKPRRDDNVALKALRATATTTPVTGLPPSAGKSSICRTRLFLLLLLLPAPWPKAGRLGVVTLTTFRPSFRAPFFRLHSDQQQLRESVVWPTFGGVPPPTIVLSRLSMPPGFILKLRNIFSYGFLFQYVTPSNPLICGQYPLGEYGFMVANVLDNMSGQIPLNSNKI